MSIVKIIIKGLEKFLTSLTLPAIVFSGMVFFAMLGMDIIAIAWGFVFYIFIAYKEVSKTRKNS